MERSICVAAVCVLALTTGASAQVNLPDGFEIIEIAVDETKTGPPAINNCGQIVFVKDRFENSRVFLYDNGKLTPLTEPDGVHVVAGGDINDDGVIVWHRVIFRNPDSYEIFRFRSGQTTIVGSGDYPRINNLGQMCWRFFRGYACQPIYEIMFFDGGNIIPITEDDLFNQDAVISDDGLIVWGRADFCQQPWVGWVMLYGVGAEVPLPARSPQAQVPDINNENVVVWLDQGGISAWKDGQLRTVTDWGGNPEINDSGTIMFYRWHDDLDSTDEWLYRRGPGPSVFYRLTEDSLEDSPGDINNWGECAWRWMRRPQNADWAGGVRYLRRIRTGDSEFDGDVDPDDLAAFAGCMSDPVRVDRLCDCRFLDLDYDGDVDLRDFAAFQSAFGR